MVSLSAQVQRDVAQKKILYYLRKDWIEEIVMVSGRKDSPEGGVIDFIRVKNVFGGISVIGFKSCDQGREKFQGTSLDYVWFDEEPPKDIYEECRMRVFDRKGDIFGTMTPLKGLTFVYEEIFLNRRGDKEVWYEFMEWADNPYPFEVGNRRPRKRDGRNAVTGAAVRKVCRVLGTGVSRVRRAGARDRAL